MATPAIVWGNRRLEAAGDDAARDLVKAATAAKDVLADHHRDDAQAIRRVASYLNDLKQGLTARLVGTAGLTAFKRASLTSLLDDVDRLVADTQRRLAAYAGDALQASADLGDNYATAPIRGAGLTIQSRLPGLDRALVDATFSATVGLLSDPMKQYADRVKVALRRVVVGGESQFGEMRNLAKVIDDKGDTAKYKAERIIRTEVGRVFNEATFARASTLAKEFPFLMKGWRSANDKRTRKGHREAGAIYSRGEGLIPFAQKFKVRVYDERPGKEPKPLGYALLRFPIDPETEPAGRLAAAATIMCRCNAFIDFDPAAYREWSKRKLASILSEPDPEPTPDPTPVPTTPTLALPPAPVPDLTPPGRILKKPADVRQSLKTLGDTAPEVKAAATAQRKLDEQQVTTKDLFVRLSRLAIDIDKANPGLTWAERDRKLVTDPTYVKMRDDLERSKAAAVEIQKTRDAATRLLAARARELVKVDIDQRTNLKPEWTRGGNADRRQRAQRGIDAFEELVGVPLPAAIKVKFIAGRSNYLRGEIRMGTDDLGVVVHELAHFLEETNPDVHRQAVAFLVRRTQGDTIQSLRKLTGNNGYKVKERATPDGFQDAYTGKWYTYADQVPVRFDADTPEKLLKWVNATEVVSMGLQKMYDDPIGFQATDPDFFDFIFDVVRGQGKETLPDDPAGWNHVQGVRKRDPASKKKAD